MQTVLERGSIDKPLTFEVGLIQLSFIPVWSKFIHATFQSNCLEGLHFCAFHSPGAGTLPPKLLEKHGTPALRVVARFRAGISWLTLNVLNTTPGFHG